MPRSRVVRSVTRSTLFAIAVAALACASLPAAADGERSAAIESALGAGDLDLAGIVGALEKSGYQGWYVLEQDAALYGAPDPGAGPIGDVRRSIGFLSEAAAGVAR